MKIEKLEDLTLLLSRLARQDTFHASGFTEEASFFSYAGILKNLKDWEQTGHVKVTKIPKEEMVLGGPKQRFSLTKKGMTLLKNLHGFLSSSLSKDESQVSKIKKSELKSNLDPGKRLDETSKKPDETPSPISNSILKTIQEAQKKVQQAIETAFTDHDADQYLTPPIMNSIIEDASADVLDVIIEHLQRQNTKK